MPSVIIVGGGITGATLALALSHFLPGTLRIELVEASPPGYQVRKGFDRRTIALAHASCQYLEQIGVWSSLADSATAIKSVGVSDQGNSSFTTIQAAEYGLPALGQTIELLKAGRALWPLLQQASGVKLHCPAKVVEVVRSTDLVTVILDDGRQLSANLLIAADGAYSALAQAVNIDWQQYDYHQIAVITEVLMAEPHYGKAFERFTPEGPLALLPMVGNYCSVVWCRQSAHQRTINYWSDEQFIQALQQVFGWRLGKILATGSREIYPLRLIQANRRVSHRVALIGNAAQVLHPVAGQGFNLGIRDVMTLVEELVSAHRQTGDIGDYRVLASYQQRRQQDSQLTAQLTDSLIHLFANQYCPLVFARQCGLTILDEIAPLRYRLVKRALGLVPR